MSHSIVNLPTPGPRVAGGYVFAGGGTGGHLFPAIAVAQALRARDPECPLLFVGTNRLQEQQIVGGAGFAHLPLPLLPRRQGWRHPIRFTSALWRSCRQLRALYCDSPPRVVIGCGGWSSFPAVWAARRQQVPIVLLEQNVLPGKGTRRLSRWADAVCLSFEESRQWLPKNTNSIVTGNPVRTEIATLASRHVDPHFEATPPLLLVLGGSLGSESINRLIPTWLSSDPALAHRWEIVHQTGSHDVQWVRDEYARMDVSARVEPFLTDIPELLARATFVICRAGATTLAEIACAGVAAVTIPWRGAAHDHQQKNGEWYASRNAMGLASQVSGKLELPVWIDDNNRDSRASLRRDVRALARPHATQAVIAVLDVTASPPVRS
ncbi:MAG: UDP-N-acetylglucosamine--N-acetylmuramyl-(pentapeptide) pyrophosphoryl-undecaprenol N-acetylglucosamine transferase [Planctomycetaceae bacterium]